MSSYYDSETQPLTFSYPNGLNMYGQPARCMECDSLYHVQGYCPIQKSRLTKRDNTKLLKEIANFKFVKKM